MEEKRTDGRQDAVAIVAAADFENAFRAQLHVGQPRAQRLRDHLAAGVTRAERLAA